MIIENQDTDQLNRFLSLPESRLNSPPLIPSEFGRNGGQKKIDCIDSIDTSSIMNKHFHYERVGLETDLEQDAELNYFWTLL